ncbi:hypothetical protein KAU32_12265 [bacterium]|nr:hypothetical protein [bacterium]
MRKRQDEIKLGPTVANSLWMALSTSIFSFPHPLHGSPAAPGDQPKRVLNRLSDIDIFNGKNEWLRSRKYPTV